MSWKGPLTAPPSAPRTIEARCEDLERTETRLRDQIGNAAEALRLIDLWADHQQGVPHTECPHCIASLALHHLRTGVS
jgi:hypothetical protein